MGLPTLPTRVNRQSPIVNSSTSSTLCPSGSTRTARRPHSESLAGETTDPGNSLKLAMPAWFCYVAEMTRLICLSCITLFFFLGCSKNETAKQPAGAGASDSPVGVLFESHSYSNCPTVRIYMKGWQDAFFDAFIDDPKGEKLLARDLPELKSYFQGRTNVSTLPHHAKRVAARLGDKMYDVYWSSDLKRVGIAFSGNWVTAYDITTGRTIHLDSQTAQRSNNFQGTAQSFLESGQLK